MTHPADPQPADPPHASAPPGPGGQPGELPGVGAFLLLAFGWILPPGIALAAVLRLAGVPLGAACLLGLLLMFVSFAFFPTLLRRLRWLPPKQRRGRPAPDVAFDETTEE